MRSQCRKPRLLSIFTISLGAALVLAGPRATVDDEMEDLTSRVLQELKATNVPCPDDLVDGWTCGQYRSDFNRLKFELEVELDLKDYDARPLSSWRLRQGWYERSWAVRGYKVSMKFGRTSHVVGLQQEFLQEEPEDEAPNGESDDDDDDDDDDDEVDHDDDHDRDRDNRGA